MPILFRIKKPASAAAKAHKIFFIRERIEFISICLLLIECDAEIAGIVSTRIGGIASYDKGSSDT